MLPFVSNFFNSVENTSMVYIDRHVEAEVNVLIEKKSYEKNVLHKRIWFKFRIL